MGAVLSRGERKRQSQKTQNATPKFVAKNAMRSPLVLSLTVDWVKLRVFFDLRLGFADFRTKIQVFPHYLILSP
ncbi:unnamed protein product [Meloidogyne enterolobii]|uniref:Uncharacterized protein n=1 Tax=Meloidogyne enterolobii TaxID=390850 RepID=A0ACB1ATQ4_MELEN